MKKGYKQTEVGEIPEDWDEILLGDFSIKVGSGITPKGGSSVYMDAGRPFVRSQNVGWGQLKLTDLAFIDEETHQTFPATEIRKGDILLNITGASIGRCSLSNEELDGGNVNQHVCIIRTNSQLDQKFVCYILLSSIGQNQIDSFQAGGNREGLNFGQIKSFRLPKPHSRSEQIGISQALSDVDELIASLENLIVKKRDMKTATMQQLLTGKTRLPGFGEGKGHKQTELGEIPEDWDVSNLGDIGTPIIGLTYTPNDVSESGTLVLRSSNIQQNVLAYENNVFVEMDIPARVIVEECDLLICVRNGSRDLIGKCALIDGEAAGSAFGAFMSVFRSKDSSFVFYQFQSDIVQRQIQEIMGATINQITNKDMNSFRIPYPESSEERSAIFVVLSDMDREISALNHKLDKICKVKQGMMQELLTGRTRLVATPATELVEEELMHGT